MRSYGTWSATCEPSWTALPPARLPETALSAVQRYATRTNPRPGHAATLIPPAVGHLLARVFLAVPWNSPGCGARVQWAATLTEPGAIRTFRTGVGLPFEPPLVAPPQPPPQQELDFTC